jgi:hypothetical protein
MDEQTGRGLAAPVRASAASDRFCVLSVAGIVLATAPVVLGCCFVPLAGLEHSLVVTRPTFGLVDPIGGIWRWTAVFVVA